MGIRLRVVYLNTELMINEIRDILDNSILVHGIVWSRMVIKLYNIDSIFQTGVIESEMKDEVRYKSINN
jgi:hypothetical protein